MVAVCGGTRAGLSLLASSFEERLEAAGGRAGQYESARTRLSAATGTTNQRSSWPPSCGGDDRSRAAS
jgi:hypothetical protein